ncbi:MAG: WD40 repeat domain-containing protein [Chlorobia bacterium]|nr:WD40 repeat domain-containing protein [Fimbriimonadaceae bacterium]
MRKVGCWIALLTCCVAALAQDAYNAGISLSPDQKHFAVGNAGKEVHLYRLFDGKRVRTFRPDRVADAFFLTKPAFSMDGKFITAGNVGPDGGVNPVWRVSDGKPIAEVAMMTNVLGGYACNPVAFSGDGKYIIGQLYGYTGALGKLAWTTRDWRHAYLQPQPPDTSGVVAISPKGNLIAEVHADGNADFWEFEGNLSDRWTGWIVSLPKDVQYASFSGDGNVLVMAGDGWCAAHDWRNIPTEGVMIDTEKRIDRTVVVKKSDPVKDFVVRSVVANEQGNLAFIGSRDGRIARINLKTGRAEKVWEAFPSPVKGLALTKSGDLLSYDLETVRVWSHDGVLRKTIK